MERKRNTPTIHTIISPLLFILAFTSILELSISTLSFDFYAGSCPNVELLVRNTVRSAAAFDQTAPAKLLRLVFHDCMVEGCDGSVLLEGNGTERADPANASLGGFQVVDSIKNLLEFLCPGTVSCADILALAARESVLIAGGPFVRILTGRRDGRVSSISNVRPNMVDTTFSMEQMAQVFSSKGLSMEDLVTLSDIDTSVKQKVENFCTVLFSTTFQGLRQGGEWQPLPGDASALPAPVEESVNFVSGRLINTHSDSGSDLTQFIRWVHKTSYAEQRTAVNPHRWQSDQLRTLISRSSCLSRVDERSYVNSANR